MLLEEIIVRDITGDDFGSFNLLSMSILLISVSFGNVLNTGRVIKRVMRLDI